MAMVYRSWSGGSYRVNCKADLGSERHPDVKGKRGSIWPGEARGCDWGGELLVEWITARKLCPRDQNVEEKKLLHGLLLLSTETYFSSLKVDIVILGRKEVSVWGFEISYPQQTPDNEISLSFPELLTKLVQRNVCYNLIPRVYFLTYFMVVHAVSHNVTQHWNYCN
jgi:hypothetical protein